MHRAEIGGVDAAGDEERGNAVVDGAANVGREAVADGERRAAAELRDLRFARGVDRRVRLADEDRLAAELGVEPRERAGAIDEAGRRARPRCRGWRRPSEARARPSRSEQRAIVVGRLDGVVEEAGAADQLRLRLGGERSRRAPRRTSRSRSGPMWKSLRRRAAPAISRARHVAGGHEPVIGVVGDAELRAAARGSAPLGRGALVMSTTGPAVAAEARDRIDGGGKGARRRCGARPRRRRAANRIRR